MSTEGNTPISSSGDPEIEAMRGMTDLLKVLNSDAQERVLKWAQSRFGVASERKRSDDEESAVAEPKPIRTGTGVLASPTSFDHPAELFEATRPKSDAEKALVLAYWFQVNQGATAFVSRQVNDELKHIGHGVGNITRALDTLVDSKPALVIQLEKSGKSQQSQKKFRITHEGLKRVQQLLSRGPDE
jgi:hypothetical protein